MFRKNEEIEPLIEAFIGILEEEQKNWGSEKSIVYVATPQNNDFTEANFVKTFLLSRAIRAYSEEDLANFVEFQFGGCKEGLLVQYHTSKKSKARISQISCFFLL